MFTTPVVYNFFIRPEISILVFKEIRALKPLKLYLVSDGPRNDNEKSLILENRNQIDGLIDWSCDVHRLYLDKNHGIDSIMELTYDFVFSREDRMIFLEEDILPSQSFFYFCEDLLEKYKDDDSVFLISGMNFLEEYPSNGPSYFFVDSTSTWGMAIWKRTYDSMQKDLGFLDNSYYSSVIRRLMLRRNRFAFYQHLMVKKVFPEKKILDGEFWLMGFNQNILYNALNIVPSVNLVLNIGNSKNAEHSDEAKLLPKRMRTINNMKKFELTFPLVHPKFKIVDYEYKSILDIKNSRFQNLLYLPNKLERALRILIYGGYSKFFRKSKLALNRYRNYTRYKNKFK